MAILKSLKFSIIALLILLMPFVSYSNEKNSQVPVLSAKFLSAKSENVGPGLAPVQKLPDKNAITAKTAKLRIPFIENQGQIKDETVKFYANTFAGNLYV